MTGIMEKIIDFLKYILTDTYFTYTVWPIKNMGKLFHLSKLFCMSCSNRLSLKISLKLGEI